MAIFLAPALCVSAVAQRTYNPDTPATPGAVPPPFQTQVQNPVCTRLEGQLAAVERGYGDPGRVAQVKRFEDTANRQQADLDRLVTQSRRLGCQASGLFSIFSSQPPQCNQLNSQIDQARANLDRTTNDLQRFQSGSTNDQESQRQNVIAALAQNNCGPQYRAAAQPRGIFDSIFGGNQVLGGGDPSLGSGFKTLCVRTCDGYYYPISFATSPARFGEDEQTCRATCPAAEVALYSVRTGEDVRQAVSMNGRVYTELPNAFRYRQQFDAACSCRRPGQSWADAMGQSKDLTVERGDIIVNEERSKALSQPKTDPRGGRAGAPPAAANPAPAPNNAINAAPSSPAANIESRSIRTVGPTPYPVR
jgi:hypothetical protein